MARKSLLQDVKDLRDKYEKHIKDTENLPSGYESKITLSADKLFVKEINNIIEKHSNDKLNSKIKGLK